MTKEYNWNSPTFNGLSLHESAIKLARILKKEITGWEFVDNTGKTESLYRINPSTRLAIPRGKETVRLASERGILTAYLEREEKRK